AFTSPSLIYTWDLSNIQESNITLRIYLTREEDYYAERRVTISLNLPTPTPSITPSPTPFPDTVVPTDTSIPVVPTETSTGFPTDIPTETPTP
ncbi:MAG: hypothetical protein ACXW4M_10575, partial [Anaerolineales bacterium]